MPLADLRAIVSELCSPRCAGRRPGTPGGLAARGVVMRALREAGLDPFEQAVPACGGANVLATLPGDVGSWVVVGAHFDHLGEQGGETYWGADDNAAAVAVLVEVARALRGDRSGRGVVFAAFDAEEPPHFLTSAMGSQAFLAAPPVPRSAIDFMVCLDLVGHRLGPDELPDEVGHSLFALGAEHSAGSLDVVRSAARSEPGVVVRPMDADVIPPLSDYDAFWRAEIPFLFLSAGRSAVYHTPLDTPDRLDFAKIDATARWLTRFVQTTRVRDPIAFDRCGVADATTLEQLGEVLSALVDLSPAAEHAGGVVEALRAACDREGRLPPERRAEVRAMVAQIEAGLG